MSNFENSSSTEEVIFKLVARGNNQEKKTLTFSSYVLRFLFILFFIVIVIFINIDLFPSKFFCTCCLGSRIIVSIGILLRASVFVVYNYRSRNQRCYTKKRCS